MKLRWLESRILWGTLLILGGVMFLLQNLGVFQGGNLFWTVLIGIAGVYILSVYFTNRANWWALIPGIILLSLAAITLVDVIAPNIESDWGGPIILGGIGLSFWTVYLANRDFWWSIIPGGVMLTLAVVAGLDSMNPNFDTGGIFFLGLALTFALLAVLPGRESASGFQRWAFIPAVVLAVIGLLILASSAELINYFWPAALILGGLFLLVRAFLRR